MYGTFMDITAALDTIEEESDDERVSKYNFHNYYSVVYVVFSVHC